MNKKYHIPRQRIMGYTSPIIQRFYEKWGEDYLQRALPNESRQEVNPIIPNGQHPKVEKVDRLVFGQRSVENKATLPADNSNLEEMFIGSKI